MVEVVFVAPRPHHAVDAGAATDGLAHGLGDGAAIDARAAFSAECPVELAALVEEPGSVMRMPGFRSSTPASRSRTCVSGFSASRRATTGPEAPEPMTM